MLKMEKGSGPMRLLDSKFKNFKDDILPRVDGIAPVRRFAMIFMFRSFMQLCKVGGILPSNWLYGN
jgi:hypothetical protein